MSWGAFSKLRRAPAIVLLAAATLAACAPPQDRPRAWRDFGGDAERGAKEMVRAQCGACHEIPGVEAADGLVGPPLGQFSRRTVIAGFLPNTPSNLVRWLRDPQGVLPGNAMPSTGLGDQQARDVAAYLYTLR
ncbi:MAG: c-type cytochrome [Caulobacteraceae bacterium]|nr:c-type cytochrome [Caulobacteraceae bacterium]